MTTPTILTEAETSKTIQAADVRIHYHEAGKGEPVVFLHSYNAGSTAWLNFHKNLVPLSNHFRCILMDLVNWGRSGPLIYKEYSHVFHARMAIALLDALGIQKASMVGNSVGGSSVLACAVGYPDRVNKIVVGACHIPSAGTTPDPIGNRPSEGSRANNEVLENPTQENIRRSMRVHLDDETLVTNELVEYMYQNITSHPDHQEARRNSVGSGTRSSSQLFELPNVNHPTLVVQGRYDRMVSVEAGLTILNYIPDSRLMVFNRCGHWPPYEHPDEYNSLVLNFLKS